MEKKSASGEAKATSESWVVEMEKLLGDTKQEVETERWGRHSIYRVPELLKRQTNSKDYRPELVSLGPFHHGDPELLPMEEHKRWAVLHLVKRSGKPLREFVAAVTEVAEQLMDTYKDLVEEWRGENNKERFVEMMLTDGCFLVEVMRMVHKRGEVPDYTSNDPIFSEHGYLYVSPSIYHDIIVIENQLPLLLIQRILVLLDPDQYHQNPRQVNKLVLDLFGRPDVGDISQLGLHPLDILHSSLTSGARQNCTGSLVYFMPSAEKMQEAGILFRVSATASFLDIHFERGRLSLASIVFDENTAMTLLNLMAFERLHPRAKNDVIAYVGFMGCIIDKAKDVELLKSTNIILGEGNAEELAKTFNDTLNRYTVMSPYCRLHNVRRQVNKHCRKQQNKWRANLIQTYCSTPWVSISLVGAVILLVATLMQTVYTVVPFYKSKS